MSSVHVFFSGRGKIGTYRRVCNCLQPGSWGGAVQVLGVFPLCPSTKLLTSLEEAWSTYLLSLIPCARTYDWTGDRKGIFFYIKFPKQKKYFLIYFKTLFTISKWTNFKNWLRDSTIGWMYLKIFVFSCWLMASQQQWSVAGWQSLLWLEELWCRTTGQASRYPTLHQASHALIVRCFVPLSTICLEDLSCHSREFLCFSLGRFLILFLTSSLGN